MVRNAQVASLGLLAAAAAAFGAEPVHTLIDDAWSTPVATRFSGRLTEPHAPPDSANSRFGNFARNTRLLFAGGESGTVSWQVGDIAWTTRTDEEGYWSLATTQPLASGLAPGWHPISAHPPESSAAHLYVLDPKATLGVISDLDDTLLVSDVVNKSRLLKNSLTVAPADRLPVEGMAEMLRQQLRRAPNPETAPLVYLSASPRQLTDSVRTFLRLHDFPRGILQLREISDSSDRSLLSTDQRAYKTAALEEILAAFPDVRFVLLGDDGEQDPEIYAALREKFPDRIDAIWIRRVHPDPARARFEHQGDTAELLGALKRRE